MKKVFNFLAAAMIIALGFSSTATAQTQTGEGNIIIDPYYGFPNFGVILANTADTQNDISNEDITIGGIGPAGLRAEYMLSDKFGIGVDFIFNSVTLNGTADSLESGEVVETYDVKGYMRRYRIQLRANYHFAQTDVLDAYVGVGAGTNIRSIGVKTDFPNYDNSNLSGALIPVSMRLALGFRYYFTDNIGLQGEIGIGGPLVAAGFSFKF